LGNIDLAARVATFSMLESALREFQYMARTPIKD
jgi:hypothetical protein